MPSPVKEVVAIRTALRWKLLGIDRSIWLFATFHACALALLIWSGRALLAVSTSDGLLTAFSSHMRRNRELFSCRGILVGPRVAYQRPPLHSFHSRGLGPACMPVCAAVPLGSGLGAHRCHPCTGQYVCHMQALWIQRLPALPPRLSHRCRTRLGHAMLHAESAAHSHMSKCVLCRPVRR